MDELLRDKRLTPAARIIASHFARNRLLYGSARQLAAFFELSPSTVRAAIADLVTQGLLDVEQDTAHTWRYEWKGRTE